jgi:DNA-binding MarR family transcriptional regulator
VDHPFARFMDRYMERSVADIGAVLQEAELSMPQLAALHALHAQGSHSVSSLGRHLRLSLAATSHLVERLVARGLVTRTEDPTDRRQKRVALSQEGVAFVRGINSRAIDTFERLLADVPQDVRDRFDQALAEVADALQEAP